MKKEIPLRILVLLLLLLHACNPLPFEEEELPTRERSSLHILNLYSGSEAIDITLNTPLNTQSLAKELSFKAGWPENGYASLLVGTQPDTNPSNSLFLEIFDNSTGEALITPEELSLAPNIYSSIMLIDSFEKPLLVKTIDNFSEVRGDSVAQIRFVNVNRFRLSVSLVSKNGALAVQNLNFLNYSSFRTAPVGTYTFFFKDDFSGVILDSISHVPLRARSVYNFFLTSENDQPTGGYEILSF